MIDLKYALEAFQDYRKEYPSVERINLKVAHMKRVMKNNINLARKLNLSIDDVLLAGLIGLLHDLGRFEQVKQYDTFIDSQSVNHAMLSSELLFKNGLIRKFIEDDSYDSIIKSAIENHNRFEIENNLTEREILHSKMIRDSDKADIYIQVLSSDPKLVFDGPYSENDTINKKVFVEFMRHHCIKTEDMRCKADDYVRKVALIYGFYFPESMELVSSQDLINRLTNYFKSSFAFINPSTIQTIDTVNKTACEYIQNQLILLSKSTPKNESVELEERD